MMDARGGAILARRPTAERIVREWDDEAAAVVHARSRTDGVLHSPWWQVLGGPGTGKSSLIADVAVSRIAGSGSDPESVLVLTHSALSAASMRERITAGLFSAELARRATREPLVRTVHAYAFAVLRLQAAAHGNPPPRLLTGSEQDSVIREMLRGEIEDGAHRWPESIRPALGLAGFASELRDLMLRGAERGLGPEDLVRWGRRHKRPEWVAAGSFAASYEAAMLLRGSVGVEAPEATAPGLDAAELIGAALTAFATDPDLLLRERRRIRHLAVDDAQHLDPQAAQLVRLIGAAAESAVVAGDPDQSVFSFRGADSTFLTELDDREGAQRIVLRRNFRSGPDVGRVADAVAARLPGASPARAGASHDGPTDATVRVEVLGSAAKEAAAIADACRRAHLIDGIEWSSIAVVVRSVPRSLPPIRRALQAAGVPVVAAATDLPLHRRRGAAGLLSALAAAAPLRTGAFTADAAVALLEGPIGGADPLSLRRLRRGLRRAESAAGGERDSTQLLRSALVDDETTIAAALTDVESAPLRRTRTVVMAARKVLISNGRAVEDALWAAWQASGLGRKWVAASARGGPVGVQADRDLDAVVALFDAAADYVDRLPRATVAGFLDYVTDQELPTSQLRRAAFTPDAVSVVSAHSAVGREWDVVVVAGVQEGLWPGVRSRGSILGTGDLVDIAAGVTGVDGGSDARMSDVTVSRTAPLLADERRLFLVACSRAKRTLIVTAVDSVTGDSDLVRSRFVDELLGGQSNPDDAAEAGAVVPEPRRVLALPALVGELRSVACDRRGAVANPDRHTRAVAQLARLARAGVRGADPSEWYGAAGPSTTAPLWDRSDGAVSLSPSTVEQLTDCPLRWMLERHGGSDGDTVRAVTGTMVHTLVQAVAGRVPPEQVRAALEKAWSGIDLGSSWYSRRELGRTAEMLETFEAWLRNSRGELTEVGVEVGVDGVLEPRSADQPHVRLRGRIDRLERDPDGRTVVVDVKTAKNPVTKSKAAEHAQLAAYQVAAAAGAIDGEPAAEPGGARLVFVAKPHRTDGATERTQPALDSNAVESWRDTIADAAVATRGPVFEARVNDGCRHCPIASSCPAQDTGRQVSEG